MTKLQENYNKAVEAYIQEWCKKHEFDCKDGCWVGDRVGEVFEIADVFVSFTDIRTDIDRNATPDQYWEYYWASLDAFELKQPYPNYENWLKGCPRISNEELSNLRKK